MTIHIHLHRKAVRDESTQWLTLSNAIASQLQVGKNYKLNGRRCTILAKEESGAGGSVVKGVTVGGNPFPMVKVRWRDAAQRPDSDGNVWEASSKTLITRRGKRLQVGQTLKWEDGSAWAKAHHGGYSFMCEGRITGFGDKNGVAVVDFVTKKTYKDGFVETDNEWKYASEV